jgi:hypothetical protein
MAISREYTRRTAGVSRLVEALTSRQVAALTSRLTPAVRRTIGTSGRIDTVGRKMLSNLLANSFAAADIFGDTHNEGIRHQLRAGFAP